MTYEPQPQSQFDLLAKYRDLEDLPDIDEPSFVRAVGFVQRLSIAVLDGSRRSFPYGALNYMHFDGGRELELLFDACSVKLEGHGLIALYDAIRTHSVKEILVLDAFTPITPTSVIVDKCTISAE